MISTVLAQGLLTDGGYASCLGLPTPVEYKDVLSMLPVSLLFAAIFLIVFVSYYVILKRRGAEKTRYLYILPVIIVFLPVTILLGNVIFSIGNLQIMRACEGYLMYIDPAIPGSPWIMIFLNEVFFYSYAIVGLLFVIYAYKAFRSLPKKVAVDNTDKR